MVTCEGEFLGELTDLGFEDFDCLGLVFETWEGGFAGWTEHFGMVCTDKGREVAVIEKWEGTRKHRLREIVSGIRKVSDIFDAMDIAHRMCEGVMVQYEREEDEPTDL